MRFKLAPLALALALLACGGPEAPAPPPKPIDVNRSLYDLVQRHYLWLDTLPGQVDPAAHATPQALLRHLTAEARRQNKDRWSYIQKTAGAGSTNVWDPHSSHGTCFGAILVNQNGRLWVAEVLPGSGAERAGLGRGDEVLAAALELDGLGAPQAARTALNVLQGETAPGTTVHLRLRKASGAGPVDAAVTASRVSLDLVPQGDHPVVFEQGGHRVGYFQLRAFKIPARPMLRRVCADLRRRGVTDLIVDLRYNAGGEFDTALLLANLIRSDRAAGQVMVRLRHNQHHPDEVHRFQAEPEALTLGRVAFIVTGHSASASELVPNALIPYFQRRDIALVGSRTRGKPVGTTSRPIPGSDLVSNLVEFQVLNAAGTTGYFDGLPDPAYAGSFRPAADDLRHAPGDRAEASTAAALDWIVNGGTGPGRFQGPTAPLTEAPDSDSGLPDRDPDLPGLV